MEKKRGFRTERALAVFFVLSALLLIASPITSSLGNIPQKREGESVVDATRRNLIEDQSHNTLRPLANVFLYTGVAGLLLTLGAGLAIAYGVGPGWMQRQLKGLTVQELFADDGTNKYFGADPPRHKEVKYYVRVVMASGEITEFFTDRPTYRRFNIGDKFDARVLGRRLIKID